MAIKWIDGSSQKIINPTNNDTETTGWNKTLAEHLTSCHSETDRIKRFPAKGKPANSVALGQASTMKNGPK